MTNWVVYGTELEELDDEKSGVSNKRPLAIEEQVVKDEMGRRRFHGAFTGGFSAGYFNTVGSKEGWVPKKFRSSLDERGEKIEYKPEDFMDEEDLNEFGIAARRIKTSANIGGDNSGRNLLAWERSMQSSLESSLSAQLQKIIKPTRDSVGIQLLKKMGWREGQGIGSKMSRKGVEKQKLNEDRTRGKQGFYNEEAVMEADEMAPYFLFAPRDFDAAILKSSVGVHGLGYRGIQHTSVLSEKYGILEAALKIQKKGRGISGQAFGVGAFENDDANIYTNYDLSQYDFAVDSSGAAPDVSCSANDTTFVMASKRQLARQFFAPPRIPPSFRPMHSPIHPDISQMPLHIKQFSERMNHLQRARFLGETDPKPVFELIRNEDRERLGVLQSGSVIKNAFDEEPMKQARFKQYVNYLKRGLNYPKPSDMTRLEWDQELRDFQNLLPSELRLLVTEVEKRQKPLAGLEVAAPIADVLKLKFISSANSYSGKMKEVESDERLVAVKMKLFGEKTRSVYDWHPAKQLAKRFNVPDPYPSSNFLGVLDLQKTTKKETLENLGADLPTFGSTAHDSKHRSRLENINPVKEETSKTDEDISNPDQKPSEDFLKAIFGESDDSGMDSEDEKEPQVSQQTLRVSSTSADFVGDRTEKELVTPAKVLTVMDMDLLPEGDDDDDKEFGPVPPPSLFLSTVDLRTDFIGSDKKEKKHRKHSREKRDKKKEKKKHRRE